MHAMRCSTGSTAASSESLTAPVPVNPLGPFLVGWLKRCAAAWAASEETRSGSLYPSRAAASMVTVPGHLLQSIADLVEVAHERIAGRGPERVRPARIQSDKLFKRGSPKFTVMGAGDTCREFQHGFRLCAGSDAPSRPQRRRAFRAAFGHDLLRDARPARRAGRTPTDRSADSVLESRGACPSRRR